MRFATIVLTVIAAAACATNERAISTPASTEQVRGLIRARIDELICGDLGEVATRVEIYRRFDRTGEHEVGPWLIGVGTVHPAWEVDESGTGPLIPRHGGAVPSGLRTQYGCTTPTASVTPTEGALP